MININNIQNIFGKVVYFYDAHATNELEDRFDKGTIVGVESQNGQEIVIYLKVKNTTGNMYTVPAKHCFETIGALRKFIMSSLDKVLNELREIKIE